MAEFVDGAAFRWLRKNFRPYAYVDEQGHLNGVAGDYLRLIEERLGIRFEVHEFSSFAETLEAAKNRNIDVVPFAIAAPERKSYLNFTQPFFHTRDRILTRVETQGTFELDDLAGLRVGLVAGYALQAEIEANRPEIDLVPVANQLEGVRSLSLGMIDALIVDVGVASYHIQQEGIANLRIAGEVGEIGAQTFGIRSDWPILNSIVGKSLASISDEEREEIRRRWINIGGVDPGELEQLWNQIAVVGGAILLITIAILLWISCLRRLVARRTFELERELAERRRIEAVKERLAVAVEQSAEYVLVVDTSAIIEHANLSFLKARGGGPDLRGQPFASLASGNARDVTLEEQLEFRLRQGEILSALGTLASGIAHDFNNLLVPILGNAELIRLQTPGISDSSLDAIIEAAQRARDITRRILLFGRGSSGAMEPIDLRYEIEDAMSLLNSLLPDTIELQAELSDCPAILGDRTEIQQILLNLCTNAGDAMAGKKGVLSIRLEKYTLQSGDNLAPPDLDPGDYARLTVSDTGIGMGEEKLERVFDPYFTEKLRGKGTGLGLAIVHGIMSTHGGAIHIKSTPGQGTRFRLFFPTVPNEPVRSDAASESDLPKGSGEDPNSYAGILTDFTMPGLNGIELAEGAWAIRPEIPFAIMSGTNGALGNPNITRLAKPVSLRDLAVHLRVLTSDKSASS